MSAPKHLDVLIVGAGLSGVGAACHLQRALPGKSYAILEARDAMGGTWDLFRYPGIRSDSDMYTLGFSFKPWASDQAIADGPSILEYIHETAAEFGVEEHIRYGHKVTGASWSSADQRWTVTVDHAGETRTLTCSFLLSCTGYYRYDEGFAPQFPGAERFGGTVIHPQHWPEDLDYEGKRVVVIGSGATAVTLVPAMAEKAAHVTMLQRTPSYIVALPGVDPIAAALRRRLPDRVVHPIVRWKNVLFTMGIFQASRRWPDRMARMIRREAGRHLPESFDVDKHFTPPYDPWDQRMCLVPDADLFEAVSSGGASIVTDHIETFTETGIRLRSGEELEADVVVSATGLQLLALGGIELEVDGHAVTPAESLIYKGFMVGGVPNFALSVGYTNASWTLKCELICQYVCRLLAHMDERGAAVATPTPGPGDVPTDVLFSHLTSGYVQRAIANFPRQAARAPWRIHQNYLRDIRLMRHGPLTDGMRFTPRFAAAPPAAPAPEEQLAA